MLLNNYSVANIGDCGMRFPGAGHVDRTAYFSQRAFSQLQGVLSNYSQGIQPGYPPAYTWVPPQIGGAMSANVSGSGTVSNANGQPAISGSATLTGSGGITNANAIAAILCSATLTGSGGITNANAIAAILCSAALTGSGTVSNAAITALGTIAAALGGTGTVTANINAVGSISADITGEGGALTTENVGRLVWQYVAEGDLQAVEVLRILLAVSAGQSIIVDLGGGLATVAFRDQADTKDRVLADMTDSERTSVTVDGT